MVTYPGSLRNDCRLSVLAESFAPIMHYTGVVITSPKRVNGSSVVFVEIELVP